MSTAYRSKPAGFFSSHRDNTWKNGKLLCLEKNCPYPTTGCRHCPLPCSVLSMRARLQLFCLCGWPLQSICSISLHFEGEKLERPIAFFGWRPSANEARSYERISQVLSLLGGRIPLGLRRVSVVRSIQVTAGGWLPDLLAH